MLNEVEDLVAFLNMLCFTFGLFLPRYFLARYSQNIVSLAQIARSFFSS